MEKFIELTDGVLEPLLDLVRANGGTESIAGELQLPAVLGSGLLQWWKLEPGLTLFILRGTLQQALALPQRADTAAPVTWLLLCQMARPRPEAVLPSSVQLSSSAVGSHTLLPAHVSQAVVGVSVAASLLESWLTPTDGPLAAVLAALQPVELNASLAPNLQLVISQLIEHQADRYASLFFYNTKVRELFYQLLREIAPTVLASRHLHAADVEKVQRARTLLLAALDVVPTLPQLAAEVGLRVPVLQTLFRQVFGSSPYQYFQEARMQEARRLLQTLSVSEVGFHLGFNNLSHFARLFQKHYQLTPKKYQMACAVPPCFPTNSIDG